MLISLCTGIRATAAVCDSGKHIAREERVLTINNISKQIDDLLTEFSLPIFPVKLKSAERNERQADDHRILTTITSPPSF